MYVVRESVLRRHEKSKGAKCHKNGLILTLLGAHFSVKLILAINGNLGVFGVADHDSGIRIPKLKMADPRWRLCDSNVEFSERFAQNTLYGGFLES